MRPKIGDFAENACGVVGLVLRIVDRDKQGTLYLGVTPDRRRWQSFQPEKVERPK